MLYVADVMLHEADKRARCKWTLREMAFDTCYNTEDEGVGGSFCDCMSELLQRFHLDTVW